MRCPVCDVDLRQSDLGEHGFVVIDTCPKCSGIWCDKTELDRLDDSVWTDVEGSPLSKAAGHAARQCPRCSETMEPLSPEDDKDLVVDRCTSCGGFWLDHGELERMRQLTHAADGKIADRMQWAGRPPGCSRLRWAAALIKEAFRP
jgi:Zn-finger nucleic acid-binding protein